MECDMTNVVKPLIEARASANFFDPSRSLSDEEIAELAALAVRAPSAFNLQNWKLIAVRTPEAKKRLKAVSFNQQKVEDASVTFIICGVLDGYKQLSRVLQPAVAAGLVEADLAETWNSMATQAHAHNPGLQRDEAFRSASLAAMTLMLAAQGRGLVTGAMSGFDPQGVSEAFELDQNEVPVILVAAGYPLPGNWEQKPRRPLDEVLVLA